MTGLLKKRVFIFSFLLAFISLNSILNIFINKQEIYLNELLQNRNNSWVHYGDKSIKSRIYEVQRSFLSMYINKQDNSNKNQAESEILSALIKNIDSHIDTYSSEKREKQIKATEYDRLYNLAIKNFDYLQIASFISELGFWVLLLASLLRINNLYLLAFSCLSFIISFFITCFTVII